MILVKRSRNAKNWNYEGIICYTKLDKIETQNQLKKTTILTKERNQTNKNLKFFIRPAEKRSLMLIANGQELDNSFPRSILKRDRQTDTKTEMAES